MSVLLGLLVLVPALAGPVCFALPPHVGARLAGPLAVGTAVLTAGLAVAVTVTRPRAQVPLLPGRPFALGVDTLSAVLVLTVAVAALVVLLFTAGSPENDRRLSGLLLMFTAAMLVTVTAENFVTLLVGWELMGVASYALIGHDYREQHRVGGGNTAFLTTRTGDVGLYVAAGAALAAGTTTFADVNALGTGWAQVVAAGVVVAALGKSAQLPFSGWLSAAMLGPSPVSALLHSATMVAAGGYLLLRLHPLLAATGWTLPVAWVGAVTGVVMGAVALVQRDLKQLLAASTCAQLGFVVLAAGTGAIAGGVAALVAHAATKALLFLCAGAWLEALGTKDIDALRGVGRRYPVIGAAAVVGALSLAGVPPLALWVGKDAALAVAEEEHPVLYGVGLVAAVLSAAYGARVLVMVLAHPPEQPESDTRVRPGAHAAGRSAGRFDSEQDGTRHVSIVGTAAVVALAVLAAGLGLVGLTPTRDTLAGPWASWPGLVISAGLAVAVVTAVVVGRPSFTGPRWLFAWVGTTRGLTVIGSATLRLADVLARVDDRGLGRVVTALAGGTVALAGTSADRVEPVVTGAVARTAATARRLGSLARRPQTGQLHTYYAQAVVVLVALAVLIAVVR